MDYSQETSDSPATTDSVESGARTVENVARHFAELKDTADGMLETFGARERGYFTPSEDDEVRHLLISYWQPRCALLELVMSLHEQLRREKRNDPALFLVGFAGALVLIDAARHLREKFHKSHIIRHKLNEPEPHFGIPEGVYDTVQKSLTRPTYLWHMYHAVMYYERNKEELRSFAQRDERSAAMFAITERLQTRLQVRMQDYAAMRLRVRSREFWTGLQRDLLFRAVYGMLKMSGCLAANLSLRPGHRPQLPPEVRQELSRVLAPGDVLVTRKEHAITNYFLPGFWPHAALYLGHLDELEQRGLAGHAHFQPRWQRLIACDSTESRRVLEAMKDGVLLRSLQSPCSADSVVVLRPHLTEAQVNEALARAMFHEGKAYDFNFDFTRSDRLVCTEVVYRAYEGVGDVAFQLSRRAGRMTLSADDLIQMALRQQHFAVAAVFVREKAQQLLLEDSARQVVAQCATRLT